MSKYHQQFWGTTNGVTRHIHGPSMNGHHDYLLNLTIHRPSMDGHLATPLYPSIHGCHSYCVHPWTIHGWTPCLLPPLCLSIRRCQSYCAIHGLSIDGHLDYPPLSKYPWMSKLLCPSMDHPWMNTLLPPFV